VQRLDLQAEHAGKPAILVYFGVAEIAEHKVTIEEVAQDVDRALVELVVGHLVDIRAIHAVRPRLGGLEVHPMALLLTLLFAELLFGGLVTQDPAHQHTPP